jgi:hypothetical protein
MKRTVIALLLAGTLALLAATRMLGGVMYAHGATSGAAHPRGDPTR